MDQCVCNATALLLACFSLSQDDVEKGGNYGEGGDANTPNSRDMEAAAVGLSQQSQTVAVTSPSTAAHWNSHQRPAMAFLGRLRVVDGKAVLPSRGSRFLGDLKTSPAVGPSTLSAVAAAGTSSNGIVVTKQRVRQALAYVSARYPQGRPTRGNLKQVFHFLTDDCYLSD